ncbi:tetratricopeptide repeat protein [Spiribacter vilamensis]|uniref:Tetratricopeptide repeat protein n=1 Tax=Spiribacter vilamensis TaxID=531306 RepID=A0A4Q8CZH9_9GAMM|nr:tetratricopeptide repeat protein [Spiribacter vilamensis]RZU98347.1 tetratricopeptide repeat protein [Spiribacter vilamensis]
MRIGWRKGFVLLSVALLAACTDTVDDLRGQAVELQAGGQYQAALAQYRKVLETQPDDREARLGVAENNLYLGEYARALDALQRAAALGAEADRLQPLLAAALLAQRDYEGVIDRIAADSVADPAVAAELFAARATAYLAQGESARAEAAAEAAMAAKTDSVRALTVTGWVALAQDDRARARDHLERAVESDDQIAAALFTLAGMAAEANEIDLAIEYLAEAIEQPATDRSTSMRERFMARGQRIELLLQEDRVAEASEVLEVMLRQGERHPYANYVAGLVAVREGRLDEAVERLQTTLAASSGDVRAKALMAAVRMEQDQPVQAIGLLQDVLAVAPDNRPARLRLVAALRETDARERAVEVLIEGVRLARNDPRGLASLLAAAGDDIEAVLAGAQPVDGNDGESEQTRTSLARALLQSGNVNPEVALAAARQLAADHPDNISAHNLIGGIHLSQGRLEAARMAFERARDIDPASAEVRFNLGFTAAAAGDLDQAALHFQRGFERAPGNIAPILRLAEIQRATGNAEAAAATFEKALATGGENASLSLVPQRLALAAWYLEQASFDDASRHYEALVRQTDRAVPGVLNNLAWVYLQTGDERALATAQEAHELAPDNPAVQDTLGWIHFRQGRVDEAVALLSEAAEQASDAPETLYHLGAALAGAGNPVDARVNLERALELDEDADWAGQARRLLEAL